MGDPYSETAMHGAEHLAIWRAEMQKVADAADISVLFFSAGHIWVIFGPFWVILGHFWVIFCANFLWQNMPLCYLNRFLQL